MTDSSRTAVLVFSRAPVPGETKRRLIPALGPERAAALHARMLEAIVGSAVSGGTGPVTLYCTPNTQHECFVRLGREYGVRLRAQTVGDLGERMYAAFAEALQEAPRVIVVGSDCPSLTPRLFVRVSDALARDHEAVIVPATDGGYVLLGLRKLSRRLFEGIEWGSARVAQTTVQRLTGLGWHYLEMEPRRDIDRPEDVADALRSLERLEATGKTHDKTANY